MRTPSWSRRWVSPLVVPLIAVGLVWACNLEREIAPVVEPRSGADMSGRVVAVGDGDSMTILVRGNRIRLRLAQIDAPELNQPHGYEARAALMDWVEDENVSVQVVDVDQYDRRVSEVFVGEIHVNRELVRDGHAWANTRFARSRHVGDLETQARAARRGLWALPEAKRDAPWVWRREHGTRSRPR